MPKKRKLKSLGLLNFKRPTILEMREILKRKKKREREREKSNCILVEHRWECG